MIEYKNVQFEKDKFACVYLPRVIDGNEYKAVESLYQSDGSYILKERHGIRLVFQQHGEIGEFSFISPPQLAPLPHQIRTQACESMDGEKTSGYNADSAKGPYVEGTDCFRHRNTRLWMGFDSRTTITSHIEVCLYRLSVSYLSFELIFFPFPFPFSFPFPFPFPFSFSIDLKSENCFIKTEHPSRNSV